jgi:hypothetical protein
MKYEYIRTEISMDDLSKLNALASVGFRVVAVVNEPRYVALEDFAGMVPVNYALLERPLP